MLSATELHARRILDHDAMRLTFPRGHPLMVQWQAYSSIREAEARRACGEAASAAVYEVTLNVKSPVAPDRYERQWRVRIDATARDYPLLAGAPKVTVMTSPRPWLPHVGSGGQVCLGTVWSPTRLLAHLAVDMIRMLNFDEDPQALARGQRHYNPDSIGWWVRSHGARPIQPIVYPSVVIPGPVTQADDLFGEVR